MARGDLTDAQWARSEPLLPVSKKPGRPPIWTRRQLIDGIQWRTRTGAPWRDVPTTSAAPSPNPTTRPATARSADPPAAARPPSTARSPSRGTLSNAGSTASKDTARSQRDTANSPSASRPH
ncbi:transposase [Streptomyces hygroscopicus]|uniref:transposase n=1 Tax=Streptomyces hygroscopicus TaxID=1912 RepID=UPI003D767C80